MLGPGTYDDPSCGLIVSLVVQSGAVLGSTAANLPGCHKNCGHGESRIF